MRVAKPQTKNRQLCRLWEAGSVHNWSWAAYGNDSHKQPLAGKGRGGHQQERVPLTPNSINVKKCHCMESMFFFLIVLCNADRGKKLHTLVQ